MKTRINFLDNLRTFLIFLVILLHAGINYSFGMESFWIINDPDKKEFLLIVNMYLDLFVMVAMFFISGYFIPASLHSKTDKEFILSKVKRILVPWVIAVFTLIPAYKFIMLSGRGLAQEEWYSYFHLFTRTGTDIYFFPNNPTLSWLWFLPVLFVFQIAYWGLSKLNLLRFKISLRTAALITLFGGTLYGILISVLGLKGWYHSFLIDLQRERILIYFMVFLLGTLTYKSGILNKNKKNKTAYILANVTLTIGLTVFTTVAINFFYNIITPDRDFYFISELADRILYYFSSTLSMLSFLYLLVHLFRFNFKKTNKLMAEFNRNSYSVYIIHVIVIGVIGLILLNLNISGSMKYIALTILTFIVSNLLVSGYRDLKQKQFTMKSLLAIILVFGLSTIAVAMNPPKFETKQEKQESVTAPSIPIHSAIIMGNMDVVKAHIAAGTNINETEPYGGATPLMTATTFGKKDIALYLIEAGADINFQKRDGSTPLHVATFFSHTEIVEALLKKGADKTIKDNNQSTAMNIVQAPFEMLAPIYDGIEKSLAPMGFKLDRDYIKTERLKIAELLK